MDIWMRYCKRRAKCANDCEEPIIKGTIMVVGKIWRSRGGEKLVFTKMFYWHPQCWISQGIRAIKEIGYTNTKRRIATLKLTTEQRYTRSLLLRRRAMIKTRLVRAIDKGDIKAIDRLLTKIISISVEIEPVGGAPKKWNSNKE